MSSGLNAAQHIASTSSSSSSATLTTSMSDREQATTSSAASSPHSTTSLYESDDDLSDAPESPVFPASPSTSTLRSTTPSTDSDSDISDAPDSPIWPEGPKAQPAPPRCTEKDCPVRKAIRNHYQGPYLQNGESPLTNDTIFRDSNPPPHVWESWKKILSRDRSSTVEDDWNVLGFLRWHVENSRSRVIRV